MNIDYFEANGLKVPVPVASNEVWAIARKMKRNSCGRVYPSRAAADVEIVKVTISDVNITTAYEDRDDMTGHLAWHGTAYAIGSFGRDLPVCAGNIADNEVDAMRLYEHFKECGLHFDPYGQVKNPLVSDDSSASGEETGEAKYAVLYRENSDNAADADVWFYPSQALARANMLTDFKRTFARADLPPADPDDPDYDDDDYCCDISEDYIFVKKGYDTWVWEVKAIKPTKVAPTEAPFTYGGYSFIPERKLRKEENSFEKISRKLIRDPELGMWNVHQGEGAKFPYVYKDFFEASPDKECDLFRCVENLKLYIPCENELFIYDEQ